MNILITGIKGYIGNSLKLKFQKKNKIFGVSSKTESLDYQILLKKKIKPQVIFHCAGTGLVGINKIPYLTHKKKNLESTKKLIKFIKKIKLKKSIIVFLSSQAVYGKVSTNKISEKNKTLPISDYGKTKLIAEKELLKVKNNSVFILRIFSIYGIGLKKQIIWDACKKFKKNKLTFRGDGEEKRDYLNINDFTKLSEKIINSKKKVKKQILNVGSGSGIKISILLDRMKNLYGIKKKISFSKKYNKFEYQNYVSSNLKVEKFLNWKPKKNLSKELNNYIRWFKKL